MNDLLPLFTTLLEAYGPQHWWPARTPFEMLTGAILTQNTAWTNVEKAIAGFGDDLTPAHVLALSDEALAAVIRPSGYHHQKAKKLKVLAAWFLSRGADVRLIARQDTDALRLELLSLHGVGPETADSMLVYAFDKTSFVVDAYTRRIFSRLGLPVAPRYDDFRHWIEGRLPVDLALYNEFHALIVTHAKQHCQAKPRCADCPLACMCLHCSEFFENSSRSSLRVHP